MNKLANQYDRTTRILRWIARILGTLIVLIWLVVALDYGTD